MLDFTRFEVLTFDCYGTLINWEDGILACLHRILAAHGKDLDDATILRRYGDYEAQAELGEYRRYREVLRSVVRKFGENFKAAFAWPLFPTWTTISSPLLCQSSERTLTKLLRPSKREPISRH
jgi:FMN phosphatase YigB (HAD superfamily)